MPTITRTALLVVAAPLALLACGGEEPPPQPPPTTAGLPTPPPVESPPPPTASAASTATTPPPAPEIPWKDLYDMDNPPTPHVATKDDDAILTKAIGAHKKSQADCKGAKATVATIQDDAQGSFTGKGQQENAYTVRLSPCGAKDDTQDKFKLIVVGQDGKVARNIDVNEQWIAGTSDIDSDGDNEILLVGTNSTGGVITNTARLVELTDASKLQIIFDWHEVTRSTCNGTPDDKAESAKIQYRVNATGGMDFQAAKKPGTCPPKK
jgi:hypothetical protein